MQDTVAAVTCDGSAAVDSRTMYENACGENESSPPTTDEPTINCPFCNATVDAIGATGPDSHQLEPCGHQLRDQQLASALQDAHERARSTTDERPRVLTDGGRDVSWTDLHSFKRDVLVAIAELEKTGAKCYGLAIKEHLEDDYRTSINHGRIYPNLDDLARQGLIEIDRDAFDDRTNAYALTDDGRALLSNVRDRLLDVVVWGPQAGAVGGVTDE